MIDIVIKSFLGSVGTIILEYYRQNAVWINSLVLIYGLLVYFARRNYRKILNEVLSDFYRQYGNRLNKKNREEIHRLLKKWNIPLHIGKHKMRFPFITSSNGLLIYPINQQILERLISLDVLANEVMRFSEEGNTQSPQSN